MTVENVLIDSKAYRMSVIVDSSGTIVDDFGGGGGTISIQRDPYLTLATTPGTINGGAKSVTIANTGSANGTVLGVQFPPGASITYSTEGADTLAAIAYDATGTTFLIATVV